MELTNTQVRGACTRNIVSEKYSMTILWFDTTWPDCFLETSDSRISRTVNGSSEKLVGVGSVPRPDYFKRRADIALLRVAETIKCPLQV